MDIKKIPLNKIVTDKKNPRKNLEEAEAMADSLQKHGQFEPCKVEDLKNGQFYLNDGHRRRTGFKIIKQRTGKEPLINCIVENKLTDEERLLKQCAIDAQTKNWTVTDRDAAWLKVWNTKKYKDRNELRKALGTTTGNITDFFDRQNLSPSLKKLNLNAGLLQETKALNKTHRAKVLKYAAKTGIGAMGLRQQVKELKNASDESIDAFTKQEIGIEDVKKLKGLNGEKQKIAIEAIKGAKKHIARIPQLVKKIDEKPENKTEQKKINAQIFVNKLNDTLGETSRNLTIIEGVLQQIKEQKLDEFFSTKMKEGIIGFLEEVEEDVEPALKQIKNTIKEWR